MGKEIENRLVVGELAFGFTENYTHIYVRTHVSYG